MMFNSGECLIMAQIKCWSGITNTEPQRQVLSLNLLLLLLWQPTSSTPANTFSLPAPTSSFYSHTARHNINSTLSLLSDPKLITFPTSKGGFMGKASKLPTMTGAAGV